jgi:hypothetical protein
VRRDGQFFRLELEKKKLKATDLEGNFALFRKALYKERSNAKRTCA